MQVNYAYGLGLLVIPHIWHHLSSLATKGVSGRASSPLGPDHLIQWVYRSTRSWSYGGRVSVMNHPVPRGPGRKPLCCPLMGLTAEI
jgi:hypothetical protein